MFNASQSHNLFYSFRQCRTLACLPIGHIVSFLGNNMKNLLYTLQSRAVAYNQSMFSFLSWKILKRWIFIYACELNVTQFHELFVKQWVAKKGKKIFEEAYSFWQTCNFFFSSGSHIVSKWWIFIYKLCKQCSQNCCLYCRTLDKAISSKTNKPKPG